MSKYLLVILALSALTHFIFFGYPSETVFDEVHFGKFVSGYYTGEYYFDIHPPLGKLMIAGFAKLFDFKPEFSFAEIGEEFPDNKYLALRFLPALAGTLLPLVIFLLILELGLSRIAAFAGALLIVFDNALLTQSRLILLDPFLLLFGFTSLLFYFKYRRSLLAIRYWLLAAVFGGLAISIKWTGLTFLALPLIMETYGSVIKRSYEPFIKHLLILSLVPLMIYFSIFALHFALLPKPGPGDAFMKPGFRENNVAKNILDLNQEMYKSNQRLTATHPYSSRWYTWPLVTRPIFYWVDSTSSPQIKDNPSVNSGQAARIYFLGNPVIWWSSTIAIILALLSIIRNTKYEIRNTIIPVLLGGYFLNLLPFIGVKRVMFLYHYLTALIFAILILVYLIEKTGSTSLTARKNRRKIFTGLIIASIAAFLFFSPLSYGLPLSQKAYDARVWFVNWR